LQEGFQLAPDFLGDRLLVACAIGKLSDLAEQGQRLALRFVQEGEWIS